MQIEKAFRLWFLAALFVCAGSTVAQTQAPPCPWLGVKHNCRGEMTLPNGSKYVGEFKNGKRHGRGEVNSPTGVLRYVGEFKDDQYEGRGTLELSGGWRYEGDFKANQLDGHGTFVMPDGRKYVGQFGRDNFNGKGTLTYQDGRRYVGEFKDDEYHGTGTEFAADGTVLQTGQWERGRLVGNEVPIAGRSDGKSEPIGSMKGDADERVKRAEAGRQQVENEMLALKDQLAAARAISLAGGRSGNGSGQAKLKARALVIGNGAYTSFGKLANPQNDARAIAAKFRAMGIEADLVLDADRDTIVKALNEYANRAANTDVNILYYAGHGLQIEGINYIIPTNMRADGISVGYVKLNGIALNAAMDYLPAGTRLIFLDACRDNSAARSLSATRGAGGIGLAPVSAATGTLIAYATKEGAVAADGDGDHSPYTSALLHHLDAPLDIGIVLRRVRQTVLNLTGNRQEPWEYGSLIGDQLILSRLARD